MRQQKAKYLVQSVLYLNQITRLTSLLRESKIPHIILKGLPLHFKYEGTYPRRIFSDIDILVPASSRGLICILFAKLEYHLIKSSLSSKIAKQKDKVCEESFLKRIHGLPVVFDIHYEAVFMMTQLGKLDDLYPQNNIELFSRELFENTTQFKYESSQFPLLKDEYLVLYLALHLFHHNFCGTHRVELIRAIVKKKIATKDKMFKKIGKIIKKYHLQGYSYGSFLIMKRIYKNNLIPEDFLDSIKPSRLQSIYLEKIIGARIAIDDLGQIRAGIVLFFHLFLLSPHKWRKKMKVFTNPIVVLMLFVVIKTVLSKYIFFGNYQKNIRRQRRYNKI